MQKNDRAKYDIGILGLMFENNYGCVLTGYALYQLLKDLKCSCAFIDRRYKNRTYDESTMSRRFLNKNADIKLIYHDETYLLNNSFDTFITGSDQLWNFYLDLKKSKYFLLDFAKSNKRKIAYATAIGNDWYTVSKEDDEYCKYLLDRFDLISVRESYVVDILKEKHNVLSNQVLDPVFLCDCKHYDSLVSKSNITLPENYIFAYILDPNEEKNELLQYIAKKLNKKVIVSTDADHNGIKRSKITVDNVLTEIDLEDWLNYYKYADYIVTDSFHGTCFSILFKKQFVSMGNVQRGIRRFEDLLRNFNLTSRMFITLDELKESNLLLENIDYDAVYKIIDMKKRESMSWLINALNTPINNTLNHYDVMRITFENEKAILKKQYDEKYSMLIKYIDIKNKEKYYKFKYLYYKTVSKFIPSSFQKIIISKMDKYKNKIDFIKNFNK